MLFQSTILALIAIATIVHAAEDITTFQRNNYDLSDFLKLLNSSPYLSSALPWRSGTLLAPTNQAIRDYTNRGRSFNNLTLMYHYANVPRYMTDFETEDSLNSELPANPPVWISRKDGQIYLNDAKVIRNNLRVRIGLEQIVHVIDKVLEPTIPTTQDARLDSPTARKFLENTEKYGYDRSLMTSKFSTQAAAKPGQKIDKTTSLLDSIGKRTFFIPVDDGFKKYNIQSVDSKTIDGHIIPDRAIFLRSDIPDLVGGKIRTYKTSDFASNFPVFISFDKEMVDGKEVWLVRSDNREGDRFHLKGVVQAQIVKANIPVKNGVVHLISKPLVIINTNVYETLKLYASDQGGNMRDFNNLMSRAADSFEIRRMLEQGGQQVTLFVPSNMALQKSTELDSLIKNPQSIADLIKLHILMEPISSKQIIDRSSRSAGGVAKPLQIPSASPDHKLLFNSISIGGREENQTIYVEGGGVNATIIQPDFGATNGYIHVIDKILGIPNHNMEEKLRSHPLLQTTYKVWMKEHFDDKINSSVEPLTFFAPSEIAWRNLRFKSDSAYHNILHGGIGAIPSQLLERHLMVKSDYTIERLAEMTRNHVSVEVRKEKNSNTTDVSIHFPLVSLNGYLRVARGNWTAAAPPKDKENVEASGKKDENYYVGWQKMTAHVVRTNVKCTNGIIHIIDTVLMNDHEVTVAAASRNVHSYFISILFIVFWMGFQV